MAAIARDSSRFAGVKTFSEKFSQPEVDAEGRVKKVSISLSYLLLKIFPYQLIFELFLRKQELFCNWYFRCKQILVKSSPTFKLTVTCKYL